MERYPKKMIYGLSIGSLVFAYTFYLIQLFEVGDAYMVWLVSSVVVSASLWLSVTYPTPWSTERIVLSVLIIMQVLSHGYATFLATYMYSPYSSILSVFGVMLILYSLVVLYQTALRDRTSEEAKVLHGLTITVGVLLTSSTAAILYVHFLLIESESSGLWKFFIPFVLYVIIYVIQVMMLRAKQPMLASILTVVQVLIPMVIFLQWLRGGMII